MDEPAPEYVAARKVLLHALSALDSHLSSLVLVGAQAVYHHTGATDLNVPLMTTDADLAVDTRQLADAPEIGSQLRAAGFRPGANPGHWVALSDVAIDLMVVPHQAGTDRRSARAARIAPHEKATARIAHGLEPALIDNEMVTLVSLDQSDPRTSDLRVAGPAALLTAKMIKIGERLEQAANQRDRVKEKDALDVFRLLQAIDVSEFVVGFQRHREDEHASAATAEALSVLRVQAAAPGSPIPQIAASAAQGDPAVPPAFAALVSELITALPPWGASH
ncbi:hypothetical protein [Microlunatus sp. GCM10028923]|uniref:hypothetical protein n=1 Tax=Microlunatus sp. GCM10028923 TaxID=3273400 RepID=UPI0036233F7C